MTGIRTNNMTTPNIEFSNMQQINQFYTRSKQCNQTKLGETYAFINGFLCPF